MNTTEKIIKMAEEIQNVLKDFRNRVVIITFTETTESSAVVTLIRKHTFSLNLDEEGLDMDTKINSLIHDTMNVLRRRGSLECISGDPFPDRTVMKYKLNFYNNTNSTTE